jgi:hypothetical protein
MSRRAASWALTFAVAPLSAVAQTPLRVGPEFAVNSFTTQSQYQAAVAARPDGRFVVA